MRPAKRLGQYHGWVSAWLFQGSRGRGSRSEVRGQGSVERSGGLMVS